MIFKIKEVEARDPILAIPANTKLLLTIEEPKRGGVLRKRTEGIYVPQYWLGLLKWD